MRVLLTSPGKGRFQGVVREQAPNGLVFKHILPSISNGVARLDNRLVSFFVGGWDGDLGSTLPETNIAPKKNRWLEIGKTIVSFWHGFLIPDNCGECIPWRHSKY